MFGLEETFKGNVVQPLCNDQGSSTRSGALHSFVLSHLCIHIDICPLRPQQATLANEDTEFCGFFFVKMRYKTATQIAQSFCENRLQSSYVRDFSLWSSDPARSQWRQLDKSQPIGHRATSTTQGSTETQEKYKERLQTEGLASGSQLLSHTEIR